MTNMSKSGFEPTLNCQQHHNFDCLVATPLTLHVYSVLSLAKLTKCADCCCPPPSGALKYTAFSGPAAVAVS